MANYKIKYKVEGNINGVDINEVIEETTSMSEEMFDTIMDMVDDAEEITIISSEEVSDEVKSSPLSMIMNLFKK